MSVKNDNCALLWKNYYEFTSQRLLPLKISLIYWRIQTALLQLPGPTMADERKEELEESIASEPHTEDAQIIQVPIRPFCCKVFSLEIVSMVRNPLNDAFLVVKVIMCIGCTFACQFEDSFLDS